VASLDGLVQSIRLWNRAASTLIRLNLSSRPQSKEESDPFGMSSLKEALLSGGTASKDPQEQLAVKKNANRLTMDGLEWRISEGLLSTLFSLSRVYHLGGSAREAEYFAQQAADIAEELNLPAMVSRALAKKGEVQLQMGKLEEAHANLVRAEELLRGMPGIDTADVRRLKVDYQQRTTRQENGELEFAGTVAMLEELDAAFRQFDNFAFGYELFSFFVLFFVAYERSGSI
jgi:separase